LDHPLRERKSRVLQFRQVERSPEIQEAFILAALEFERRGSPLGFSLETLEEF